MSYSKSILEHMGGVIYAVMGKGKKRVCRRVGVRTMAGIMVLAVVCYGSVITLATFQTSVSQGGLLGKGLSLAC